MIAKIIVFIFGSIVGSFLNVCIHRMPKSESVVWPRSHCPKCQKRIPGYDNIPFISYILLKGRCRFCKEKISLRYPLVELLTALLTVALFNRFGLSYSFFLYMVMLWGLIIATFVDIRHRIIPDEVSIGGLIIGFIMVSVKGFAFNPLRYNFHPMLRSLLGIVVGGGIIYLTGVLFDLVYFKWLKKPAINGETESMGGGDVKLLAMIGAFIGWQKALLTFFLAPFLGIVVSIATLIKKNDHTIPYGPFLSFAALVSLFWADKIIQLILPIK
ncbi:MAG: prepilin peptidase [Candidatus Omnitrophica bacterium]|jgi:leader peptidase (prepilin peptidase)/N-methyltransferase|nr:prepilin peptidase [Candidatus Omnitrophota bacterium]MDD5690305.1 prepilin peptidase [Candidatus Omnitrophota bacterium]